MKRHINELVELTTYAQADGGIYKVIFSKENFAKMIIRECEKIVENNPDLPSHELASLIRDAINFD